MTRHHFPGSSATSECGFSLIEAIMALSIMGLVGLGALTLTVCSAKMLRMGQDTVLTLPQVAAGLDALESCLKKSPLPPVAEKSGAWTIWLPKDGGQARLSLRLDKSRQLLLGDDVLLDGVTAFAIRELDRKPWSDASDMRAYSVAVTIALADDTRPPMEFSFTVMSASHKEEALL